MIAKYAFIENNLPFIIYFNWNIDSV